MKKEKTNVIPLFRGTLDGALLFSRASMLDEDPENWALARNLYLEASRLVPRHVESRNNYGVLCHRLGDTDEALRAWRKALDIDAKNAECLNNIGHVLQEQGNLEAASVYLLRAVESDPEMEEARFNLALCLQALGRPRAALKQWRAYLRRWPRSEYASRVRQHVARCRQAVSA